MKKKYSGMKPKKQIVCFLGKAKVITPNIVSQKRNLTKQKDMLFFKKHCMFWNHKVQKDLCVS